MQEILTNKGFSGPARCDARVAQARGATEMLDRKRWFLSDCEVPLHYLGVVRALNTSGCSTVSLQMRASARSCNPRTSAANIQVSASSSCEEFLNKSGGTVNPAAPARKASSKETALQRQEPRVKHGVDERRHT
jgi:hypothetical protein